MAPVFGDCGAQVGVNADDSRKKSSSLLILDPLMTVSVIPRTNQRNNVGTKNIYQYCLTFSWKTSLIIQLFQYPEERCHWVLTSKYKIFCPYSFVPIMKVHIKYNFRTVSYISLNLNLNFRRGAWSWALGVCIGFLTMYSVKYHWT